MKKLFVVVVLVVAGYLILTRVIGVDPSGVQATVKIVFSLLCAGSIVLIGFVGTLMFGIRKNTKGPVARIITEDRNSIFENPISDLPKK